MPLSTNDFHILDALDKQDITSQRQLSKYTGISLGQVNYVLKRLLEKGLVKIGNFQKNPRKITYAYLLTPKGIEAKSKLAVKFVMAQLREYNLLREHLANRLGEIQQRGVRHVIFVGPVVICEFVRRIIQDRNLDLRLDRHIRDVSQLCDVTEDEFEVALLFDEAAAGIRELAVDTGVPKEKLIPLW